MQPIHQIRDSMLEGLGIQATSMLALVIPAIRIPAIRIPAISTPSALRAQPI